MTRIVLDSSAVIALLKPELGADAVSSNLPWAALCTVNLAEIVTWMVRRGDRLEAIRTALDMLNMAAIDFDSDLAIGTGILVTHTLRLGLSLADRACLAAASRENVPALTADRAWQGVDVGVDIQFIR